VKPNPNFYGEVKPDLGPKKIDETEAHKLKESEETKKDSHSAWNTSGTWEERNLKPEFIKDVISASVAGFRTKDGKIEITEILKLDGEGKLILSRGKKRVGFEINFKVHYQGLGDLEGGRGSIKFKEFLDDGDYEHEIIAKGETNKDECRDAVKSCIKEISQAIYDSLNKLKN